MAEPKYRIPRMAAVALVLGGASCDDGEGGGGGGTAGVNVSDARIERMAKKLCENGFECSETRSDYEDEYGSEGECVETVFAEAKSEFAQVSNKCGDAYLDYYECYFSLGCSPDESECEELYEAMVKECPEFPEDDEDDDSTFNPALRSLRKAK